MTPLKEEQKLEDYYWGNAFREDEPNLTEEQCSARYRYASKLLDASVIQNLCWIGGLAPRVYAVFLIRKENKLFPAQLVDYVYEKNKDIAKLTRSEGSEIQRNRKQFQKRFPKKLRSNYNEVAQYLKKFDCSPANKRLVSALDFVDDKLIDFQGYKFGKKTKEITRDLVNKLGYYGKGHYQSVPELKINAHPRNTTKRIDYMKLDETNFQDKRVLDIGCSSGVFCNYAAEHGAKYCLGLDLKDPVSASRYLSNYLHNFNNDYAVKDLRKDGIKEQFDIVFFLSMNIHIGFPKWLPQITNELLIFEENRRGSVPWDTDATTKKLSKWFKDVQLGASHDHGGKYKPLYFCRK
jgi:hypothetical protein